MYEHFLISKKLNVVVFYLITDAPIWCFQPRVHVIGVCSPSQSASEVGVGVGVGVGVSVGGRNKGIGNL